MKILLLLAFASLAFSYPRTESIYSISITTIEGQTKSLSEYQGKKILIVTLPIHQNPSNDSLLYSLDSLRQANISSLKIIGVPSYEDGYTPAIKTLLVNWYRTKLDSTITITDGQYTYKASGSYQHPLFKWLTNKTKNGHFGNEVLGPRSKFFIKESGELIAFMAPSSKLNNAAMNSLLAN